MKRYDNYSIAISKDLVYNVSFYFHKSNDSEEPDDLEIACIKIGNVDVTSSLPNDLVEEIEYEIKQEMLQMFEK